MTSKPPDAIAIGREIMDEDREVLAALTKAKVPDAVIEAMDFACFANTDANTCCLHTALAKAESMGWTLQPKDDGRTKPPSSDVECARDTFFLLATEANGKDRRVWEGILAEAFGSVRADARRTALEEAGAQISALADTEAG